MPNPTLAESLPYISFGHSLGAVSRAPLLALYELSTAPADRIDFNNVQVVRLLFNPTTLEYATLAAACRVQENKAALLLALLKHNWVYADVIVREGDRKRREMLVRNANL